MWKRGIALKTLSSRGEAERLVELGLGRALAVGAGHPLGPAGGPRGELVDEDLAGIARGEPLRRGASSTSASSVSACPCAALVLITSTRPSKPATMRSQTPAARSSLITRAAPRRCGSRTPARPA